MADAPDATRVALGPSEKVEEQESGDREDNIEEVWDVSDLRCNCERIPSAEEPVRSLYRSLSLPMPATVVEKQQHIEDAIRAFADYPRLEVSVRITDTVFAVPQENWEQKTVVYENDLAKLRKQVSHKFTDLSKIEDPASTVLGLESKGVSSQSKIQDLKKQLLASSKN